MWDFIKLTLFSNDRQTMIRVNSIVQMYEDPDSNGKECTRIEFENSFTRVKEDMLTIITLIRNTRLNSIYGLTGGFTHIYADTDSVKNKPIIDEQTERECEA